VVGVVQVADSNMDSQVAVLQTIADDVGEHINKGYLPKWLIWQNLQSMVWPSIHYPLPTMMISDEE
jgi:hypothetical protein